MLKDQFIFSIENKKIQDHLLVEISESDNSIKTLYEARKVESKLAQRKMLGIVNPSLVSIGAIKNRSRQDKILDCNYCSHTHGKGSCPAYGKVCSRCGRKNHFDKKCRQDRSSRHKGRHTWFDKKDSKCIHRCDVHEINEDCHEDNGMNDLANQVQSLFYH